MLSISMIFLTKLSGWFDKLNISQLFALFSGAYWLDFFDDLLSVDHKNLNAEYAMDGTHLRPNYINLMEQALQKYFSSPISGATIGWDDFKDLIVYMNKNGQGYDFLISHHSCWISDWNIHVREMRTCCGHYPFSKNFCFSVCVSLNRYKIYYSPPKIDISSQTNKVRLRHIFLTFLKISFQHIWEPFISFRWILWSISQKLVTRCSIAV